MWIWQRKNMKNIKMKLRTGNVMLLRKATLICYQKIGFSIRCPPTATEGTFQTVDIFTLLYGRSVNKLMYQGYFFLP